MWLWFNKSTSGPNAGRIDLENFSRGHVKEEPLKGKVLYYALVTEKPYFESFQRIASSGFERFFGLYTDQYAVEEDAYYLRHPSHTSKHHIGGRVIGEGIITKWRLNTQAQIFDGEKGRGADNFQKDPVILEVFSLGTVVTTYEEVERQVEDRDGDGKVTGHHTVRETLKLETEFVDRVEFRLVFRGALWSQWFIDGDSKYYESADVNIASPFFDVTFSGGWFAPSLFNIKTKEGVDPAFAILLAHLCNTEYSVAEIKRDLKVNTPALPNYGLQWGLQGRNNVYQSAIVVQPGATFVFKIG
jgi:hypothetical protein